MGSCLAPQKKNSREEIVAFHYACIRSGKQLKAGESCEEINTPRLFKPFRYRAWLGLPGNVLAAKFLIFLRVK